MDLDILFMNLEIFILKQDHIYLFIDSYSINVYIW